MINTRGDAAQIFIKIIWNTFRLAFETYQALIQQVLEVIKKPVHKAGCLNASFAEVKNAA